MRNAFALIILAALFATPVFTNSASAADSKKKNEKKNDPPATPGDVVEGKVSCEKKDADQYTSVRIKTDKGEIYHVTLDANGQKVGKDYDLIRVYVKGKIETKDKEKWITVTQIGEGTKRKK